MSMCGQETEVSDTNTTLPSCMSEKFDDNN